MKTDLADLFELPDRPQVVARIEWHESNPVPCAVTATWTERDVLPGLPGLREHLAAMRPTERASITSIAVWARRPDGREERVPFTFRS